MTSAEDPDSYQNQTVGLALEKPSDWRFVTAQESLENLKLTKLSDAEFQKTMEKYPTAPLIALAKHPEIVERLKKAIEAWHPVSKITR